MSLAPGSSLDIYQILGPLGAGAMGEVYHANDTRLDREVAIKVLPEHFAKDADRLQRFEREAKSLAALNHPNVAQIYGFDQHGDVCFLVLELVPGETLAERIARGPLSVEEALSVCVQIAAGVEAAHEAGVIHRDLKPGNVKLTADGKAKVLDFGLARPERTRPASAGTPFAPGGPLTEEGVTLGTPGYMSPEQVRGKPLDRRTDIFAFGCILYACLTGSSPFPGETSGDVIVAILEREPDLAALPEKTPARVRDLLANCLEKDAARRLRDIGDARIELERGIANKEWSTARRAVVSGAGGRRNLLRSSGPWILGALLGAGAAAGFAFFGAPRLWPATTKAKDPPPISTRFVVNPAGLPAIGEYDTTGTLAIAPDGSRVAFLARDPADGEDKIYVRDMASLSAVVVPGSMISHDPFFSPDGAWLGFSKKNQIVKVPVAGGPQTALAQLPGLNKGFDWGDAGIFCSPAASTGLFIASPDDEKVAPLTEPDAAKHEISHRWPELLPDGRRVLCTIKKAGIASFDEAEIAVYSLDTHAWKTVLQGGYYARYAASGHLVYVREGALMAVPFDVERLETTGAPTRVVDGVMCEPTSGAAQFALSRNGTLVFVPGGPFESLSEMVWVGRDGKETPVGGPHLHYLDVAISPDGGRIAAAVAGATDSIFVYDIARGTLARTTFEGNANLVTWTPDGESLVYNCDRDPPGVYRSRADGTGAPVRLMGPLYGDSRVEVAGGKDPALLYPKGPAGQRDLWMRPLGGGDAERPLVEAPLDQWDPHVSPDGRWLAYLSDESGRPEMYVCPYPPGPSTSGRWRVSTDGAHLGNWSADGTKLFFMSGESSEMRILGKRRLVKVVSVSTAGGFSSSPPEVAFDWSGPVNMRIVPDGERLLSLRVVPPKFHPTEIVAVVNWFEELKRNVPVR